MAELVVFLGSYAKDDEQYNAPVKFRLDKDLQGAWTADASQVP